MTSHSFSHTSVTVLDHIVDLEREALLHNFLIERHPPEIMRQPHWHSQVEINFLKDCQVTYRRAGEHMSLKAGQMGIFWAMIPHQVVDIQGVGNILAISVPLHDFLQWLLPNDFKYAILQGALLFVPEPVPTDVPIFERWFHECQRGDLALISLVCEEIRSRVKRMALTGWSSHSPQVSRKRYKKHKPALETQHVEKGLRFIAHNYADRITVQDIANYVGIHPNYLMNLFRKVIGMSVMQYVTRHRLSQAQVQLMDTNLTILTIAMNTGFGSQSRFYEAFREHFGGMSPGAFRKQFHPSA